MITQTSGNYKYTTVNIRSDIKVRLKILAAHLNTSDAGLMRALVISLWNKELPNISNNPKLVSNLTKNVIQNTPENFLQNLLKEL